MNGCEEKKKPSEMRALVLGLEHNLRGFDSEQVKQQS